MRTIKLNIFRVLSFICALTPVALVAQSHDQHGGHGAHGGHGHAHMGQAVSCENLAAPLGMDCRSKIEIKLLT